MSVDRKALRGAVGGVLLSVVGFTVGWGFVAAAGAVWAPLAWLAVAGMLGVVVWWEYRIRARDRRRREVDTSVPRV